MVIKEVPNISREHLIKRAKSVKTVDEKIISRHTRKCVEFKESNNCKNTVEKNLTKEQQNAYLEILKAQRVKEERVNRYRKKKKSKQ